MVDSNSEEKSIITFSRYNSEVRVIEGTLNSSNKAEGSSMSGDINGRMALHNGTLEFNTNLSGIYKVGDQIHNFNTTSKCKYTQK